MILKKIKIEDSLGCIIPSKLILKNENKNILIKKGTVINNKVIKLLKKNNYNLISCFKLSVNDVTENEACKIINEGFIKKHKNNLKAKNFKTGRSNLIAKKNGIFFYKPTDLSKLNSISSSVAIGALRPYSKVKKGDQVLTTKIITYSVKQNKIKKIALASQNILKFSPFKNHKIKIIQTIENIKKTQLLDKTEKITKERLVNCSIKKISCNRVPYDFGAIDKEIRKSIDHGFKIILLFGIQAINDVNDLIPKAIRKNNGKIIRFGIPVEPGNLTLIAKVKNKNDKFTFLIGMPSCAKSPKENGVDWILWRIMADLTLNNKIIDEMGIGGFLNISKKNH